MTNARGMPGEPLVCKLEGFGPLPEADKQLLGSVCGAGRLVPAGTDLICEGDAPEGVFLILDGFAGRYKLRASGVRQILAYLVPGDFCDLDVALLERMDHSIATLSACRVARITPEIIAVLMQRPALASALRRATLVDEATTRAWLLNIGRRNAVERLAHLFCELHARLEVVRYVEGDSYDLPITQADLADATGLTPVHVNRSLKELRRGGLIELRNRRLTIPDLQHLQALAEFRADYLYFGGRAAA